MTPNLLPPPEIAAATPPGWTVVGTVLLAVLLAAGFTLVSFPTLPA